MKQIYRSTFLVLTALGACASIEAASTTTNICRVTPYFSPRSQSVDLVRQVVGVRDIIEDLKCSDDCFPGYIGSVTEFTKSFRNLDISSCLFGNSLLGDGCCQAIKISGSGVANRGDNDWLADYFGLPRDFQSVVNFNPQITNVIGDLQGYFRLDRWLCGLYFYIHLPVTNTKWNLHVCEDVINEGGQGHVAGYFGPGAIGRENLLNSFGDFVSGQKTPDLSGVTPPTGDMGQIPGVPFSETFNALGFARWGIGSCGSRTKTSLADLRFWLGYDWVNCECYGFGVGAVVAAPTGNAPDGRYLFEPIVGNGHHWEFGGLVNGHYQFWQNCDGTHRVTGFTQANFTHLFNAKQVRTFDLCNKPLSRYMLAEKLTANNTAPFLGGQPAGGLCENVTLSTYKFAQEYTPVANLTTFRVDVSASIQVDWVAMLTYSRCNFTWDLGYNLWYRGCESITFDCACENLIAKNTWALKGDAHVFGFSFLDRPTVPIVDNQPGALGATESQATIHKGTNAGANDPFGFDCCNPGIDNPSLNVVTNQQLSACSELTCTPGPAKSKCVLTSIQSVFLTGEDIDVCAAQTKGLSNKIFTHVSYRWECACWEPFFGAGAMGEFGSNDKCKKNCDTNCTNDDTDCRRCSLSQWGIWIKGGFVF